MIDEKLPFDESTIESFTPDVNYKIKSERKTPKNHSDSLRKLLLLSQNQPSEFNLLDQSTDSSIQSDSDFEIGSKVWEGDEHDYWNFEDKFYKVDEKEKQEKQKQAKINRLKNQIEDLQKELDKLK